MNGVAQTNDASEIPMLEYVLVQDGHVESRSIPPKIAECGVFEEFVVFECIGVLFCVFFTETGGIWPGIFLVHLVSHEPKDPAILFSHAENAETVV